MSIKIDPTATNVFAALNYAIDKEGNLEDQVLAQTYLDFKQPKDFLQPGLLTPDGYAAVILIAKLRHESQSGKKPAKKKAPVKKAPEKKEPPEEKAIEEPVGAGAAPSTDLDDLPAANPFED